ncbi:uncharacterized protein [Argopecten irradians]|uniref:uncharacterized protein n=1 Tax=Argopecten irradians TaxID=31199 RepID=UPI003717A416
MDGDKHCIGTFRRTWISMCGLLLLLISSAGAISLSGSLEYGVPGDKFNLICDVPEEANWVSFYRSPEQHVGTVLVSNLSNVSECHFRNGTAANTTPCSSELCTCQPLDNTDLGRSFELVITPSDQDRNSSWLCTRYLQGSDNRSSALYILPVAKGPGSRLSLIPTDTSYTKFEGERLPNITCVADCTPGCSFVWEKSGIMITSRSVLSLETLDRSEAGQYTCIVSNIYGTGTAAVSVNVNCKYDLLMFEPHYEFYGFTLGYQNT